MTVTPDPHDITIVIDNISQRWQELIQAVLTATDALLQFSKPLAEDHAVQNLDIARSDIKRLAWDGEMWCVRLWNHRTVRFSVRSVDVDHDQAVS